jgi:hypothetical protein
VDRGPDDPSGPDATAAEFEAIVAGWRREGVVPAWPGDDRPPAEPPRTPPVAMPAVPLFRPASADAAGADADLEAERLDHFVPPEPPPLPRLGPPAVVGFTLLALGLTLVTVPGIVGVPGVYGLPLGLLTLAVGLGWLVLRLWPGPPDELDEDDDGAQV